MHGASVIAMVRHACKQQELSRATAFTHTPCARYLRARTFQWYALCLHTGTAVSPRPRVSLTREGVHCWDWEA